MNIRKYTDIVRNAFGRGVFPEELAWMLDVPGRGLIMSAQTVADRLPVAPSARVLEMGAGSGYYSVEAARKVARGQLDIVEVQQEMLDKCQRKLDGAGVTNYSLHLGDGQSLPFEDSVFDAIYMVTVFGEIEGRPAFLKEAKRVLKPGGTLSITEHHPDPDFEDAEAMKREVEPCGFVLLQKLGWRWAYTANFSVQK